MRLSNKLQRARGIARSVAATSMIGASVVGVASSAAVVTAVVAAPSAGAVTNWSPATACGTQDTTTVPVGVFSMTVSVRGAAGGTSGSQNSGDRSQGGKGGIVNATIPVTPGATVSAVVGCTGGNGGDSNNAATTPASNGWAKGGSGARGQSIAGITGAAAGAGGAASGVCVGATCSSTAPATARVVAGGGGSGGVDNCSGGSQPGGGGVGGSGSSASDGSGSGPSGTAGGASAGSAGAGGSNASITTRDGQNGQDSSGGAGVNVPGGSGGGGYSGGNRGGQASSGCTSGGGGGGGSSWSKSDNSAVSFSTNVSTAGSVAVTFADPSPCAVPPRGGTDADGDGVCSDEPGEVDTDACIPVATDADGDGLCVNDPAEGDDSDACVPDNTVGVCDRDGDGLVNSGDSAPDNPCFPVATASLCASQGSGYTKINPARFMDTRTGNGTTQAPFTAGQTRTLQVTGRNAVPANATAVVLNITAIKGLSGTYLTVWPTGRPRPTASSVNAPKAVARPNTLVVPIGNDGKVSIYNQTGSIEVAVDISGYFAVDPTKPGQASLTPKRILDTRTGVGGPATKFGAGQTRDLVIANTNGVPANATAAIVNITALNGSAGSYLTAFPKGTTKPNASNVNWAKNEVSPNFAVVPIGTGGAISLYNYKGTVNVLVDLVGYFSPTAPGRYRPFEPVRMIDTRTNVGTTNGDLAAGEVRPKVVLGPAVPAGATALVANLTGTKPTLGTYLTVFPTGATRPGASNVNLVKGDTRANGMVSGLGTGGSINIYNQKGSIHVLLDAAGWFGPVTSV